MKTFVKFYYQHSPSMTRFITEHEGASFLTRLILAPIIVLVHLIYYWGWLLLLGLVVVVLRNRTRKCKTILVPCIRQCLAINPNNEDAKNGLRALGYTVYSQESAPEEILEPMMVDSASKANRPHTNEVPISENPVRYEVFRQY